MPCRVVMPCDVWAAVASSRADSRSWERFEVMRHLSLVH